MMGTLVFQILSELKIEQLRLGYNLLTDFPVDLIRQMNDVSDFQEDFLLQAQAIHDKVYYMI